jgi:heat-inducible transcriptional repressor
MLLTFSSSACFPLECRALKNKRAAPVSLMVSRISTSHAGNPNRTDARGQAVLSAIIKEHLVTGEPVGSRTISDRFAHASGWSAATIRNVMGQLEEAGLVEQPHTSAGRIPTDRGYRFYVDNMLDAAQLSKTDLATINSFLKNLQHQSGGAPDRLLEKVSHVLSALSENVGIVISPSLADNRLQHIEFLQLADNRILVVMVSAPNLVHNKIIRIDENLSQEELEQTARYLNVEFSGKSLMAIRAEIVEMMRAEKALYDKLLRNAILLCNSSLEGEEATTAEVYVDGASNILARPDFADAEKMRELFRTFEEKSRLVKILSECVSPAQALPGEVRVIIGRENAAPSMQDCALITAPYWLGNEVTGTLGVVGPMRIEYARMMAVVNYMARHIEQLLREEMSVA